MLQVEALCVSYGKKRVLNDIDFRLEEGEVLGVLGVNGAGKTSLLRTISGLVRPTSGRVFFNGEDVTAMSPWTLVKRGLCHVPEGRQIFPMLTIGEHLDMAREHAGADRGIELDYVFQLFPRLKERLRQPGGSLSGGEQQMLAVGRALMTQPLVLMLDEPSHGLSPIMVEGLSAMIAEISEALPVVLVEQNLSIPAATATKIVLLENGSITSAGPAAEILAGDFVRRVYLGETV